MFSFLSFVLLFCGGFIKNFSFFSIFFVAFIFKNKNNIRFLLIMLTICIVGMGILSSGNRMPLILFVFGLLLIFLLNNKLKKVLSVSLIVLFIIFFYMDFGMVEHEPSTKRQSTQPREDVTSFYFFLFIILLIFSYNGIFFIRKPIHLRSLPARLRFAIKVDIMAGPPCSN